MGRSAGHVPRHGRPWHHQEEQAGASRGLQAALLTRWLHSETTGGKRQPLLANNVIDLANWVDERAKKMGTGRSSKGR